jgi:uncharacterized membrane protein YuzA (DUF378 family)
MSGPLRGLHHLALILVCATAFNWAFEQLTHINLAQRIFVGVQVPQQYIAIAVCVSAVVVVWHNWVD